jgi:hypothetical protein
MNETSTNRAKYSVAAVNLNDLLLQYAGLAAADLSGTALAGSVPLTNAVINTLIARKLASAEMPVVSVKVDAQAGDRLMAEVVTRAAFVPKLRVQIAIERQPIFPTDPVLHLRWSLAGMGALSAFAGPLVAAFKAPWPGVTVTGDHIAINVPALLSGRGLADVATAVRELELRTQAGFVVVRFSLGL